jgi:hypothetical protein
MIFSIAPEDSGIWNEVLDTYYDALLGNGVKGYARTDFDKDFVCSPSLFLRYLLFPFLFFLEYQVLSPVLLPLQATSFVSSIVFLCVLAQMQMASEDLTPAQVIRNGQ